MEDFGGPLMIIRTLYWTAFLFLTTQQYILKAQVEKASIGQVVEVSGESVKSNTDEGLSIKQPIFLNDNLNTYQSALKVLMKDGSLIYLGPNSNLVIKKYAQNSGESTLYYLTKGILRMAFYKGSLRKRTFLKTPSLKLDLESSDFLLEVTPKGKLFQTELVLLRGQIEATLLKSMGRRPFKLREGNVLKFLHGPEGRTKGSPLKGKVSKNAMERLNTPRSLGGKLFLYEVKKLVKSHKRFSIKRSAKRRSPASKKTLSSLSLTLPDAFEESSRKEDLSRMGIEEVLRLKEVGNFQKRIRPKK